MACILLCTALGVLLWAAQDSPAYCCHYQGFVFLQLGFPPRRAKALPEMFSRSMAVVPGLLTCNPGSFSLIPNCPFPCEGLDSSHLHKWKISSSQISLTIGTRVSVLALPIHQPARCCFWAQ